METPQADRPSTRRFRISVAGSLDDQFIDGIGQVELGKWPGGSTLDGLFIDQSHLHGILDQLWQLGIEVVRFETYLPKGGDEPPQAIESGRDR